MSYHFKRIPVLFAVLVFVFSSAGCGGRKQVVELQPQGMPVTEETGKRIDENGIQGDEIPGGTVSQPSAPEGTQNTDPPAADGPGEPGMCVVHVCGAVNRPGVYSLPAGSRIHDAIREAEGLREDASEGSVNQASFLEDGMQILIPTLEEAETMAAAGQTGGTMAAADGLVDLNSATAAELMTLPGIGQTRAEAILAYRENNGKFQTIEDIMKVDGIKEGSFQKLRELITVR